MKKFGIALFIVSLGVFIATLSFSNYKLSDDVIVESIDSFHISQKSVNFAEAAAPMKDQVYTSKFAFIGDLKAHFQLANDEMLQEYAISEEDIDRVLGNLADPLKYTEAGINSSFDTTTASGQYKKLQLFNSTNWVFEKDFTDQAELKTLLMNKVPDIKKATVGDLGFSKDDIKKYTFWLTKNSSEGMLLSQLWLWMLISFGLTALGGLLYIIPQFKEGTAGIKNDGIFQHSSTNRGWIGIVVGTGLILFYIILYWFPEYLTNWVIMVEPIKIFFAGSEQVASKWFLYGFMYCVAMLVMGIRMFSKYRGNAYQQVRTTSVLFFQLGFAFVIPELITRLNTSEGWSIPARDLKNAWPLDYTAFEDYKLDALYDTGSAGMWVMIWSIALVAIVVPIMVYFFGKRWYCSWVCGCGGLAETLGDPYRQLSDKSVKAWKIERWMIYVVMVFVFIMTASLIYTYLSKKGDDIWFTASDFVIAMLSVIAIGTLITWWIQRDLPRFNRRTNIIMLSAVALVSLAMFYNHFIAGSGNLFWVDPYATKSMYGFLIGSAFAGVVGTGFYPLMGNRVWCRFGCPLAAYLGFVQKIKSKFRITTNGGQCISCGNCSTYCEMGIDVRSYAQKGQNIVRSSCVGCGVCSAVCPRGVLKLENGPDDLNRVNDNPILIGHDSITLNPAMHEESKRA